jgi:histone H3/H4
LQAKIKKMLQSDEEMGRVASGAPVVISRALEMFIASLTKQSCEIAVKAGSRTLSAGHLKVCIEATPQFDYLKTFVTDVALPKVEGPKPDIIKRKSVPKTDRPPAKRKKMADTATSGGSTPRAAPRASVPVVPTAAIAAAAALGAAFDHSTSAAANIVGNKALSVSNEEGSAQAEVDDVEAEDVMEDVSTVVSTEEAAAMVDAPTAFGGLATATQHDDDDDDYD